MEVGWTVSDGHVRFQLKAFVIARQRREHRSHLYNVGRTAARMHDCDLGLHYSHRYRLGFYVVDASPSLPSYKLAVPKTPPSSTMQTDTDLPYDVLAETWRRLWRQLQARLEGGEVFNIHKTNEDGSKIPVYEQLSLMRYRFLGQGANTFFSLDYFLADAAHIEWLERVFRIISRQNPECAWLLRDIWRCTQQSIRHQNTCQLKDVESALNRCGFLFDSPLSLASVENDSGIDMIDIENVNTSWKLG